MIDIKFLRENPEIVKENIRKKFQDAKLPLVDEVIALDAESRKNKLAADNFRANRNKYSKQIGALMGQGKKEEAEEMKRLVNEQAQALAEAEEKERDDHPADHRSLRAHRQGRQRKRGGGALRRARGAGF